MNTRGQRTSSEECDQSSEAGVPAVMEALSCDIPTGIMASADPRKNDLIWILKRVIIKTAQMLIFRVPGPEIDRERPPTNKAEEGEYIDLTTL